MRKFHQEQVLELIKTLNEAHSELLSLYSEQNIKMFIGLLADCQECAIQIGNYIDSLEGEGTTTVSLLEEYCEILYFANVETENGGDSGNFLVRLQDQLGKIESSVMNELRQSKIEIAFLPYKASMWDSCESVWMAAKNDPQCDAYVVPIPYFDRNPDGTLGQMYYEGTQYPDYVPIVDWQSYNLEERRPDIIVIHNPYDERNRVTSVHPYFYSSRLRNLTDLLVYIPYFVVQNDVPEHFCVCAGVCNADKVFVQSEKVLHTYSRVFKAYTQEHDREELFGKAEDKFVALGSPKFDKVINMNLVSLDIPDDWRALIERPDGSRRKVVLFNTSIGAILQGDAAYLKKILHVFSCFRRRDDVVLLWRPHPLNQATYHSMRPQLLGTYEQIIAQFKRDGYGIYDETPDVHRAIAVSDAYYGDSSSSLVSLYQFTGKPLMMQDVQCVQEGDSHPLAIQQLYDDGVHYWFSGIQFNGLFKMDKQSWEVEFLGVFPNSGINQIGLYRAMAHLDGKMYFAPGSADSIAVYDMKDNTFSLIEIAEPKEPKGLNYYSNFKFSNVIVYKKAVFFVASSYPAIIRLDSVSGEMVYITDWVPVITGMANDMDDLFFADRLVVHDNCFVVASCCSNAVVRFDMDTLTSTVYSVGSGSNRYSGICYDGIDYWLSPRHNGPVVRWNMSTNYLSEYSDYPEGFSADQYSFWSIIYAENHVWLFPTYANMCIKICIDTGKMTIAEDFQDACFDEDISYYSIDHNYIFATKDSHEKMLAYAGKRGTLIAYDPKTGVRREDAVMFKTNNSLFETIFNANDVTSNDLNDFNYYESPFMNLRDFLGHLVNPDRAEISDIRSQRQIELRGREIAHPDGTAGEAIFAYLRGQVL